MRGVDTTTDISRGREDRIKGSWRGVECCVNLGYDHRTWRMSQLGGLGGNLRLIFALVD